MNKYQRISRNKGDNVKKRTKIILITIVSLIIILVVSGFIIVKLLSKNLDAYQDFDFSGVDLSTIEDGSYIGSEDATIVKATVEVTVKDHVITNVKILAHECGQGKPAEVIVNDMVKNNSIEVDAISGATYSSNIIKVAAYNALTK